MGHVLVVAAAGAGRGTGEGVRVAGVGWDEVWERGWQNTVLHLCNGLRGNPVQAGQLVGTLVCTSCVFLYLL